MATTTTRSDEDIQRDVLAELKWDARLQPNEIGVVVKDGVVTLTGWVDSYLKRWAAEEAAHRVRNVKAVANDIEVRIPASDERTDADIAAAIASALDLNMLLRTEDIKPTVSNGWVTLKGTVAWNFQRADAENLVRNIRGVKGVVNQITVRARPTPTEIKEKIEEALVRSAEADAKRIKVDVQGSKIVLEGSVRSWAERQEAERVAWNAPGVIEVEDRIQIAP